MLDLFNVLVVLAAVFVAICVKLIVKRINFLALIAIVVVLYFILTNISISINPLDLLDHFASKPKPRW